MESDHQQPTAPAAGSGSTEQPAAESLQRIASAENNSEILAVLEHRLTELTPVSRVRLWLFEPRTQRLEAADGTDDEVSPAAVATEAFESGDPQLPSETTWETTEIAYPLGTVGVVVLVVDSLSAALRTTLSQLSTVAGACLEHNREYARLEQRFHQIAERNRELSQFARTVSHDLNSPLSVIYGRIELSLAEPSNAEMHLQAAQNAAQRVDSLITDHLQSIETVDEAADTEAVSIQTVAIQAWRIVDPSTARLQVEPQLGTVEANAIRLQQLFENLIRNAIEHGSAESVGLGSAAESNDPHAVFDEDTDSVTVTIKPTADGFAVCDDGPGIPEDERSEVFESGYTTTESGSGLGLHIVSEIVESHDWEISVAESAHGGARFEVTVE